MFSEHKLKDRDLQMIRMIADGYPDKIIADHFHLSISRTKQIVRTFYTLSHVDRRIGLVRWAIRKGIVEA